jgi:hypothetical protein
MKGMQLLFCHILRTEASAPRLSREFPRRINSLASLDKSFAEGERPRDAPTIAEYSSTPCIYGPTLSCPFADYRHRHRPATGQSGILFTAAP